MSRNPPESPSLWIIAGPNGSGKSSLYTTANLKEASGSIWIINPDLLSLRISEQEALPLNPDANLEAVRRIERWLYASIEAHQTVGVETVLSSGKYRALVDKAHERGFQVRFVFVYLDDVQTNIERVRIRVSKGGHDVPEDKIRDRRRRSFEQLGWYFAAADTVEIYDNSGAEPHLVVSKRDDEITIYDDIIPELAEILERAAPGFQGVMDDDQP